MTPELLMKLLKNLKAVEAGLLAMELRLVESRGNLMDVRMELRGIASRKGIEPIPESER